MNLLLDTHTFLWFENGDPNLSVRGRDEISNPENTKFISIASFWEIAIKSSLGKLELKMPFDVLLSLTGYLHLHIGSEHLKSVQTLTFHHRDPFDRLLICQALSENLTVIGSDKQFDAYGVKRIW